MLRFVENCSWSSIYHGLANLLIAADLLNMTRNLKIITVMLCLTVVIHLMIYHEKNKQMLGHSRDKPRQLLLAEKLKEGAKDNVSSEMPSNKTPPAGDGQLYKLIDSSIVPFLPAYPKHVIILGYQRVGSSFFGQLFDRNPSFFYMYEPLDSVYTEMYGTRGGLNVPSDITYLPNGHPRVIPDAEKAAVRKLLSDILNCNVDSLPAGFILHRFWLFLSESFMPSWHSYRTCLKNHRLLKARETCWQSHLKSVCPERFGLNPDKMMHCFKRLTNAKSGHGDHVSMYQDCLNASYRQARPCLNMFKVRCDGARLWAIKTVRATMDELDGLLEGNPNTRIVHLVRDPRPVVVSRATDDSYRGIYAGDIHEKKGGDKTREARIYCGTVVRDILHRRLLERSHPGKIVQVIYEDFVQNPEAYARSVYRFLGEDLPSEVATWLRDNTRGSDEEVNATWRMSAWKSKMSKEEAEMVVAECREFYELLNYKWPYDET